MHCGRYPNVPKRRQEHTKIYRLFIKVAEMAGIAQLKAVLRFPWNFVYTVYKKTSIDWMVKGKWDYIKEEKVFVSSFLQLPPGPTTGHDLVLLDQMFHARGENEDSSW